MCRNGTICDIAFGRPKRKVTKHHKMSTHHSKLLANYDQLMSFKQTKYIAHLRYDCCEVMCKNE